MGIGYMAEEDEGAIGADWAMGAEGAEGAIEHCRALLNTIEHY